MEITLFLFFQTRISSVFCVGMGSKLFPSDKVAAEDWTYVTEKCKEALAYIAEARK